MELDTNEIEVLFVDDEIPPDNKTIDELKKENPGKYNMPLRLRESILKLEEEVKVNYESDYQKAKKLANGENFDIAIVDLDWENNFEPDEDDVEKKKENAGYNICDVLKKNSPHILQVLYSSRLNKTPGIRKRAIDKGLFPLHKSWEGNAPDQLVAVVKFLAMIQNRPKQIDTTERLAEIRRKEDESKIELNRKEETWKKINESWENANNALENSIKEQKKYSDWTFFVLVVATLFLISQFYNVIHLGQSVDILESISTILIALFSGIFISLLHIKQKNVNEKLEKIEEIIHENLKYISIIPDAPDFQSDVRDLNQKER